MKTETAVRGRPTKASTSNGRRSFVFGPDDNTRLMGCIQRSGSLDGSKVVTSGLKLYEDAQQAQNNGGRVAVLDADGNVVKELRLVTADDL